MWGFQFWANLPAAQKMMDPRYRDIKATDIPEVTLDSGTRIKIVSGLIHGIQGPVRDIVIEPEMLDVTVPPATEFRHPVQEGHTAIALCWTRDISTSADAFACETWEPAGWMFPGGALRAGNGCALRARRAGNGVTAGERGVRLFISGKLLHDPIAWYGPIVMNTQEELRLPSRNTKRYLYQTEMTGPRRKTELKKRTRLSDLR
jgi:redox-sensitive bicupin YhaK (pirin superfamily)